MTVIAADSDEEAELLASSQDQAFVRLRSGDPGKLPPPVARLPRHACRRRAQAMLEHLGQARAVGSPATVARAHRPLRRAHPGRRDHRLGRDLRSRRAPALAAS